MSKASMSKAIDRTPHAKQFDHIFWVHVPKCGGTSLFRVAEESVVARGEKLALCYTARGADDCMGMKVGFTKLLGPNLWQGFAPQSVHWLREPVDTRQEPYSVFGHFTLDRAIGWKFQGNTAVIVMIRHPLERLFSGFQQNLRANIASTFDTFVDSCISAGGRMMQIGPLLEYLGVDNATNSAPPSTRVNAAKKVIDQPNVIVLINERWSDSMSLLKALGFIEQSSKAESIQGSSNEKANRKGKHSNQYKKNVTPEKAQLKLPYGAIKKTRECIAQEESVYHHAVKKFDRMYEAIAGYSSES